MTVTVTFTPLVSIVAGMLGTLTAIGLRVVIGAVVRGWFG